MSAAQVAPKPTAAEAQAYELLLDNYFVVNHRHRIVGCLPPDKTGTQALGEASGNAQYANQISEEAAGDQYLRYYGFEQDMWIELEEEVFKAFLRAGGRRLLDPTKPLFQKGTKR